MSAERLRAIVERRYSSAIRPLLPRVWGVSNGVAVKDFRLGEQTHRPDHKAGFVNAIEECVRDGDRVIDIAAGRGVTAVVAAWQGADVTSYDASAEMLDLARQTAAANNAEVNLRRGLVGEAVSVWGDGTGVSRIPPSELPGCDVLQLDCEGAELSILDGLRQRPRAIIVETHPGYDATVEECLARVPSDVYETTVRDYEPGVGHKDIIVATRIE